MNEATRTRHAGFETLQKNLRTLVDALLEHLGRRVSR